MRDGNETTDLTKKKLKLINLLYISVNLYFLYLQCIIYLSLYTSLFNNSGKKDHDIYTFEPSGEDRNRAYNDDFKTIILIIISSFDSHIYYY